MTFTQSIKTCFFTKRVNFKGRASRSEFWWWQLFTLIISIVLGIIISVSGDFFILGIAILFLFAFPTISVTVRRLHDIGISGW